MTDKSNTIGIPPQPDFTDFDKLPAGTIKSDKTLQHGFVASMPNGSTITVASDNAEIVKEARTFINQTGKSDRMTTIFSQFVVRSVFGTLLTLLWGAIAIACFGLVGHEMVALWQKNLLLSLETLRGQWDFGYRVVLILGFSRLGLTCLTAAAKS